MVNTKARQERNFKKFCSFSKSIDSKFVDRVEKEKVYFKNIRKNINQIYKSYNLYKTKSHLK